MSKRLEDRDITTRLVHAGERQPPLREVQESPLEGERHVRQASPGHRCPSARWPPRQQPVGTGPCQRVIAGDLRQGKNVLVVAHGNSNRSIVMQLDRLSGEQVVALELATGAPLVYEMEADGATVKSKRVLG